MTWSFVGAGTPAAGTNPSAPVPAGLAAGDYLIVVGVADNNFSAIPTPTGFTAIVASTADPGMAVFYKVADGTETSIALTSSQATSAAVAIAYRGLIGFDANSTLANGNSASPATGTTTTTKINDLVISVYATNGTNNTWTAPASTTTRVLYNPVALSNAGILIVDENQAAVGTTAVRTATLATAKVWNAISVAYKQNTPGFLLLF